MTNKLTRETRAAIRTTYLSSVAQYQRPAEGHPTFYAEAPDQHLEDCRGLAREFVLWVGANRSAAGLLDMWYVPKISADELNAVMDEVDAEG